MTYEYLPKEDIYILHGKLPHNCHGFCKEVNGGRFAVINEEMEEEQKLETALHEIRHLEENDLYKDFDELQVL